MSYELVTVSADSGLTPRAALTDLRFAAGVLFAGVATFVAVDLGAAPVSRVLQSPLSGISWFTNSTPRAHPGPVTSQHTATSPGSATAGSGSASKTAAGIQAATSSAAASSATTNHSVTSTHGVAGATSPSHSGTTVLGQSSATAQPSQSVQQANQGTFLGTVAPTTKPTTTQGTTKPTTPTTQTTPPPATQLTTPTNLGSSNTTTPTTTQTTQGTSSGTQTQAPTPPPAGSTSQQLISSVDAQLGGITTTDHDTAQKLANAVTALRTALGSSLWAAGGGNIVASQNGNAVFDNVKQAIQQLDSVHNPSASITAGVSQLDSAVRLIASTAITANSCSPKNSNELTQAKQELGNGDASISGAQYDQAVDHFKNAWTHALSAQGTAC
ncbi:MAG TPA: hypothetical protein VMR97_09835 [Acidimicrobiales bacterium]|nr:hypothetical protein [Acidimicrobiales bacterium]